MSSSNEVARSAIELDTHNPFGRVILARCLSARGDLQEAVVESDAGVRLSGGRLPFTSQLGYAYARIGEHVRAGEIFKELEELSKTAYVSPYDFALINTALGRNDAAFECLERALQERTARLASELRNDPMFDSLRRTPGSKTWRGVLGIRRKEEVHQMMCSVLSWNFTWLRRSSWI